MAEDGEEAASGGFALQGLGISHVLGHDEVEPFRFASFLRFHLLEPLLLRDGRLRVEALAEEGVAVLEGLVELVDAAIDLVVVPAPLHVLGHRVELIDCQVWNSWWKREGFFAIVSLR